MTDEERDAQLAQWATPVYRVDPPVNVLENYAVCKHCNDIRMNHIDGKCLFDVTQFEVKRSNIVAPRHCTCSNGCKSATCDKL